MRRARPLLLALALFVGCGEEPPPPPPPPPPEPPDLLISGNLEQGPFGAQIGGDVQLPSDFPPDVPVYPDATPVASGFATGEGAFVLLRTLDPAPSVYDFYRSEMPEDGWSIENEMRLGDFGMLTLAKDGRSATIAITPGEEGATIMLTVSAP